MTQNLTSIYFDFADTTFVAEGHYEPADLGIISGPPEYCYPPTPAEFEFTKLEVEVAEGVWHDAMWALGTSLRDEITEAVIDAIENEDDDSFDDYHGSDRADEE